MAILYNNWASIKVTYYSLSLSLWIRSPRVGNEVCRALLKRGYIPDILCFLVFCHLRSLPIGVGIWQKQMCSRPCGSGTSSANGCFLSSPLCEYLQLVIVVSGVMVYSHSFHIPLSSSFLCVTSKPSLFSLRAGCWREACPRPEISEKSYHGPAPSLKITNAQEYDIGVDHIIAVPFPPSLSLYCVDSWSSFGFYLVEESISYYSNCLEGKKMLLY